VLPSGLQDVLSRIAQLQKLVGSGAAPQPAPAKGSGDFAAAIEAASAKQGLDPSLVRAVVQAESGGDPSAVSPVGAEGLMQLMPETARDMGVTDPKDPAQNLAGGTRYLREMLDRFHGDLPQAIAAYNAGPHAVERHGGVPPYPETRHYVDRVLKLYQEQQEGAR
jgi:soluble lytic murein transglycosylase-like protein